MRMEALSAVGCYANGCGQDVRRLCSIPQGCPLSVTVLALAIVPWTLIIRALHSSCVPRALADDMAVMTGCIDHLGPWELLQLHCDAIEPTAKCMHMLGGRVSAAKCLALATTAWARAMPSLLSLRVN